MKKGMQIHSTEKSGANSLSRKKIRLFKAGAVCLPFLIVLAVECLMRLNGLGGYPAFIRKAGLLKSGETLHIVEPAAFKPYFFVNPDRPGYTEQSNLVMPKPDQVVRIFVVGESAAKGYPQPRNLSLSAFMQEMLQSVWPDRKVEVINLGTTAVASFPLTYQVRDALKFDPDLFVFYVGNNEFFGAYGTGSINAAGTLPPWALRTLRTLRGFAIVQWVNDRIHQGKKSNQTLMEEMMGQVVIPESSRLREAAGRNLSVFLGNMLDQTTAAGIPSIVCTTASNESGLAPLGEDDVTGLDQGQLSEIQSCLREGLAQLPAHPADALPLFKRAVELAPHHATAHFLTGRSLVALGDIQGARNSFLAARDLDTMPWRPISGTESAIRLAARQRNAVLCDMAELFRQESREGATGWALMDDHVHLSLTGQVRAARLLVASMEQLPGRLQVSSEAQARIPEDSILIGKMGANIYDEYRVNHTLRVLFSIPFMQRSNPSALERYKYACRKAEAQMSPGVLDVVRLWQTETPHAGALRPVAGMAARALLRENKIEKAAQLYEIASRQVPEFTSWHLEYIYFMLACRERLTKRLTEADLDLSASAIRQGMFLLEHGILSTGLTERYIGRLFQLRGEWAEAIPYLLAARPHMAREDLVACDQALLISYMQTGDVDKAKYLIDDGIKNSGRFSPIYRQLRLEVDRPVQKPAPAQRLELLDGNIIQNPLQQERP